MRRGRRRRELTFAETRSVFPLSCSVNSCARRTRERSEHCSPPPRAADCPHPAQQQPQPHGASPPRIPGLRAMSSCPASGSSHRIASRMPPDASTVHTPERRPRPRGARRGRLAGRRAGARCDAAGRVRPGTLLAAPVALPPRMSRRFDWRGVPSIGYLRSAAGAALPRMRRPAGCHRRRSRRTQRAQSCARGCARGCARLSWIWSHLILE